MRTTLQFTLLILLFLSVGCKTKDLDKRYLETILFDQAFLANTKVRIEKNDPQLRLAYHLLIEEAEAALNEGPFTVTEKQKLSPSGDKHDYASYSRYWWPDPSKSNGLPYIRRDGETNPASQSLKESDRQRIGSLGMNAETLGLAYYFSREEKYAKKAAQLLRVWFLDKATLMNPNVNHAQIRPGHNNGTKSGVLDGRVVIRALESSLLIAGSGALSTAELKGLKTWAGKYFEWLTSNEMALEEAASKNNHGTFYDVQAIYFALYSDNHVSATQIARKFAERRILSQIRPDGSMPEEMERTRPLFYSIYNLHAMFLTAHLAKNVDVDLWEADNEYSRLKAGLDFLVPFADPKTLWPHPTIGETNRMEMFSILQMADRVYPDGNYLELTETLPLQSRKSHRSNLVLPLMR